MALFLEHARMQRVGDAENKPQEYESPQTSLPQEAKIKVSLQST